MKIEIKKPSEKEICEAKQWPVWEKGVSEFPYEYDDKETFYVLEGSAEVSYEGKKATFCKGDYVTMPKGLKYSWKISKPIRKHYRFG